MGKILKKGEYLFKEFDKISTVYILQSGQVGLTVQKNKKNMELTTVGNGYVFAEGIVLGSPTYGYSALALQECRIIEIPIDVFKEQYDSFHSVFKSFIKNQSEKLRWALNELKNKKSDRESLSCGYDEVLKVFGSIVSIVRQKSKEIDGKFSMDYSMLRTLNQRYFQEPHRRTDQALLILSKLGFVELTKVEPEESNIVRLKTDYETAVFKNLGQIDAFLDFFQYAYFKAGSQDLLKIDDANFILLQTLLIGFEGQKADYSGFVSMPYPALSEKFAEYGLRLSPTTFTALESRGLICKIKAADAANPTPVVQFDKIEFETALHCWKIIKEIDKWNEKGLVDDEAPLAPQKRALTGDEKVACVSCGHELLMSMKFCSECGAKLSSVVVPAAAPKKVA